MWAASLPVFQSIDGMLKFNTYRKKPQYCDNNRLISISSPTIENNRIILNEIEFDETANAPATDEDTTYFDNLQYSVQFSGGGQGIYTKKIPRTEYLEQKFTPSLTSSTVLVFNCFRIDAVNSEIDVRVIDPNGNFIEPTNVNVANDMCTVTIPPYSALSDTICRVYIYNPNDFD